MANLQENIQAINEAAARQSIGITINPQARRNEVKAVVVDADHQIQMNPHTFDIFVVNGTWDKAAYPLYQETVESIASELQRNPNRRSFTQR